MNEYPLMTPIDLITIIALFVFMGIVIIMFLIFYRKIAPAADKIKDGTDISLRQTIQYEKAIDKILLQLRFELNAVDVFIGRFHNGGSFSNGTRMKKFSIPYGKAASTIKELVRWRFYDKFCSHWPDVIDQLLIMGEYCCFDIKECSDTNFKKDMEYYEFASCNLFLICQEDLARTPEGFISFNFKENRILSKEERDLIKGEIVKILSLMNLTQYKASDTLYLNDRIKYSRS